MESRAGVVKKLLVLGVTAFGLLLTVSDTDAQKQPRQKDFKIAFSLLLPDGSLAELTEEIGPCNCVDEPFSGKLMTPRTGAVRVILPNGRAVTRITEGDPITLFAVLPQGAKPQFELFRFETSGSQRLTYVESCPHGNGVHLNVIGFRGGLLKDGRWVLKPTEQLAKGEYCLSQITSNKWYTNTSDANYCFGIDPR